MSEEPEADEPEKGEDPRRGKPPEKGSAESEGSHYKARFFYRTDDIVIPAVAENEAIRPIWPGGRLSSKQLQVPGDRFSIKLGTDRTSDWRGGLIDNPFRDLDESARGGWMLLGSEFGGSRALRQAQHEQLARITLGMKVLSSDGQAIGTVAAIRGDGIDVALEGPAHHPPRPVPITALESVDESVRLLLALAELVAAWVKDPSSGAIVAGTSLVSGGNRPIGYSAADFPQTESPLLHSGTWERRLFEGGAGTGSQGYDQPVHTFGVGSGTEYLQTGTSGDPGGSGFVRGHGRSSGYGGGDPALGGFYGGHFGGDPGRSAAGGLWRGGFADRPAPTQASPPEGFGRGGMAGGAGGARGSALGPPPPPPVPPATAGAVAQESTVPATERRINVWISEYDPDRGEPLVVGRPYALNLQIGWPVAVNLISGQDAAVREDDIPEAGLETEWVVISDGVEMSPLTPEVKVEMTLAGEAPVWTARFTLSVPRTGSSRIPRLRIIPGRPDAQLKVIVHARSEIYRQFTVWLDVADKSDPPRFAPRAAAVLDDWLQSPAPHLNLRPGREWKTPPGQLSIAVLGNGAWVHGDIGGGRTVAAHVNWPGVKALVTGPMANLRRAAEDFRAGCEAYLNAIDADRMARDLAAWDPEDDWSRLRHRPDRQFVQAWEAVETSDELRSFAFFGHQLYETFFPQGSELRAWIDGLDPGHRIDISWSAGQSDSYIPHIPWGLLYLPSVPPRGGKVDGMGFLGQRFRLGYLAYPVQGRSKALGDLDSTHRAHLLYWGDQAGDAVASEAKRQRAEWADSTRQIFVPSAGSPDPEKELLDLLAAPAPSPISLLYLYCHCAVGRGNDPVLLFSRAPERVSLSEIDLGTAKLEDEPLVFANACTTSASDPDMANSLERGFFLRGCRGYLGTEIKVPVEFASRFASIFFHFFYRKADPHPMAAGEAVAQTRLFLWTRYRNLGGLFYSYINQYELFMAREDEVVQLRNRGGGQ
jgi:hypothetical protein